MKDFKKSPAFGTRNSSSTETHKTTCSECHAMCEVPFRPNGKKPVYCRNCFKGKDAMHTSFTGQPFSHSSESTREENGSSDLKKQFSILNTKLDRLISAIEAQTRTLSSTRE